MLCNTPASLAASGLGAHNPGILSSDRAKPGPEQRRSRRYPVALPVDLTQGSTTMRVETVDVSRHGLFVATQQPPKERFLIRVAIHLKDGPLFATAFVSRSVEAAEGRPPGVGIQFFAMSSGAKHRWDRFLTSLGGKRSKGRPKTGPSVASFMVKLPDVARLDELYTKATTTGTIYLVTPVLREVDADVAIVVIHPLTDQEMTLPGKVLRVHPDRPRGMEIRLAPMDVIQAETFKRFVESRGAAHEPPGPWSELTPTPAPDNASIPPRSESSASRVIEEEDPSISIDIVIDETSLEAEDVFSWDAVTDDLIIDLDLNDPEPEGAPPRSGSLPGTRVSIPVEAQPAAALADPSAQPAAALADPAAQPAAGTAEPTPPSEALATEEISVDISLDDGGVSQPSVAAGSPLDSAPVAPPAAAAPEPATPIGENGAPTPRPRPSIPGPPRRSLPPAPPPASSPPARVSIPAPSSLPPQARRRSSGPPPGPYAEPHSPRGYDGPTAPRRTVSVPAPPAAAPEWSTRATETQIFIECGSCDQRWPLRLGGVSGALGLVTELRPYWCSRCNRWMGLPRVLPGPVRHATLAALGDEVNKRSLALRDLFRLADLIGPPRCTECSRSLRSSKNTDEIARAAASPEARTMVELGLRCPRCTAKRWIVVKVP